ncbi:MAG: hypothetical protein E7399_06530 [Ruminococcaceae bacterium]|nr:hypothetical protein [Oscillospiraceae bacterium]
MYINANQFCNCSCDSDMIQSAVEEARKTGQSVLIPKYNQRTGKDVWDISKAILLYDESVIVLQNAHLRLADGAICNLFRNSNAKTEVGLTPEGTQKNIRIQGIGTAVLDGGIHNGLYEANGISRTKSKGTEHVTENCMMFFQNTQGMVIENITVKNHRYWGICFYTSSFGRISNVHFHSDGNVPNQDGIDILKGCHDFIIENITGCTGDNLIAICAIDGNTYPMLEDIGQQDIYNISVKNIMGYSVNGCSLLRLLNHDGHKLYQITVDGITETSPWSDTDSPVAPNPDLRIFTDEEGNPLPFEKIVLGEEGYRMEAAVIIGESYWYKNSQAKHGDTWGVSVSNVTTHARFGVWINNTLTDSVFDNIRLFGNGYMAVYFGEGQVENVRFSNLFYHQDCKPLKEDEHIFIEWNNTRADGYSCVYFNETKVKDVSFSGLSCPCQFSSVFGGLGQGSITAKNISCPNISVEKGVDGVKIDSVRE